MRKADGTAAMIQLRVNGEVLRAQRGATVAAVLLNAGVACRVSESGEPRTALCGMGVCFECRAMIDGVPHQRTCQIECREGMSVETQR
jgi:predicted molibdopterin-dependent oxidoreductase YjgC